MLNVISAFKMANNLHNINTIKEIHSKIEESTDENDYDLKHKMCMIEK